MRALLVSTYELGRQPFGLASPAAWLARDGVEVRCADLAKEALAPDEVRVADLIAFHLPMHTATRLAGPAIQRVRALNPTTRICAYGLYAPLNETWLRTLGVDDVLGGEFEEGLAALARDVREAKPARTPPEQSGRIPRLRFLVPDRSGLPPLARYARLQLPDGQRRVVGSTEASRGCKHLCRHCPVVPVYDGQFRIVQPDVVLADVSALVAAGAEHITFGDPDFFNGPAHARRVVESLHATHPDISYDVTIKVEHLLRHRELLPVLAATGCLFVTTAVESIDDRVLKLLEKGHTRRDFFEAVEVCRAARLTMVPTFVAFHPWTTRAAYCELLQTIELLGLVDHVAPIQLAIRLLVPEGSRLLEVEELAGLVGPFDPTTLAYPWCHEDGEIDRLQQDVMAIVGARATSSRREVFDAISELAHSRFGLERPTMPLTPGVGVVPFLTEPWYCCAEPTSEQVPLI
jgi:radical SAM superfamily enzyme YgiQ (UPF0313 family)